jgi:serine/threonine-protein kinase
MAYDPKTQRCKVALVSGSGPHLTGEIECLLRRRLRIAVLITGAGFLALFLKRLLEQAHWNSSFDPAFHAAVVLIAAALAVILWRPCHLSLFKLRAVELTLFGSAAAFLAYLQYGTFGQTAWVEACTLAGKEPEVLVPAAVANALRWVLLVVTYGTIIPNTWRRCAAIVAGMALLPLLLLLVLGLANPTLHHCLPHLLLDTAILMGIASAIAIFGSYKISELHQQAFEARKLGQYQLKQRLGSGGMGEVYLAEHTLLRRPCALKVIRPEHAGDPTSLSRFEREVRSMARLTHWNTVEIYDYGHTEDGTFYYVMEYLPGQTLEKLVERYGPLAPERAVHFLRQVCFALREAHAMGLTHRDIKPSNVIACERGGVADVAKLLDFGLVQGHRLGQPVDKLTLQGTVLGSPPFMSPEQAAGKSEVDARSDIYSLGGVAYFLLTGRPPFVRETAMQMLLAHYSETAAPPSTLRPEIPADLEAVVLRCLEKDPARRFADAASLEKALAACGCAGDWTEERALHWWRERAAGETHPQVAAAITPLERTAPYVPQQA